MNRCNICCMPDTRPDHVFVDGVCPACLNRETEVLGEKVLQDLLDRHNGEVIVPSSGGKDSHYQAIHLTEMGAHVTAVTATTCHLTDIGRKNIDNLKKIVHRTIEVSPNQKVRAKLNRYGLEWVGDISWPEHVAIFSTPFRVAADTGIKLIMYGENPQRQYGGPAGSETATQMTERWVQEFGGFLGLRPSDLIGVEGIRKQDMEVYEPVWASGVEAHFLGQYVPWDSHMNALIARSSGMIQGGEQPYPAAANWWRAENWDNKSTGIHDHFMFCKYGYGRGATQIAVDVRNGRVEREDALRWIHKYDGLFPHEYAGYPISDVLDSIDLTWERFLEIKRSYTNDDLFDGEEDLRPILKV